MEKNHGSLPGNSNKVHLIPRWSNLGAERAILTNEGFFDFCEQ